MIEQIKEPCANGQLSSLPFRYRKGLLHIEVGVEVSRATKLVTALGRETICWVSEIGGVVARIGQSVHQLAAEQPQWILGEPTTLASTAVVVAALVLPNRLPCKFAVSLLLQIEYGNPVCLKIVPENVQPFTKAFGPRAVRCRREAYHSRYVSCRSQKAAELL
jgi:hypothetical protein